MTFEIGFNHHDENDTKEFYDFVGAKQVGVFQEEIHYVIELNSFEELEQLLTKINQKYFNNNYEYSIVMSFNNPCIYLDKII